MYKMAVIGDKDSVLVFKAFGADIFEVDETDREENRKLIRTLSRQGYGLILLTEQIAIHIEDVIEHYRKQASPVILLIPSGEGSEGMAAGRMAKNIERAVGIDIPERNDQDD
ncbi:MAG TPA: V-type ATP synthase subunit F [Candidatus Merdenecus merdavium]|nr:V-type ATP synthase subunit F [Candidatus Merdenecus merdavium]